MKTLSSTLEAAQKAASALPYIRARFADFFGYAARARFARHYTGSEQVLFHASVVAADGSLVRARVETTGTDTLYVSRVADPGPGSTFSSWTSVSTDVSDVSGIAMCVSPVTGRIFLFWVRPDDLDIRRLISNDHGATWSGLATIATSAAAVGHMAAAAASDGNILLLWSVTGGVFYRTRSQGTDGAVWSSPVEVTAFSGFLVITGLAVTFLGDWQVVITVIQDTTFDFRVYATRFGFGGNLANNTWGALRQIVVSDNVSGVAYATPAVTFDASCFRLFFTGALGVPNTRRVFWTTMELSHDFNEDQWREPVPFDYVQPTATGNRGVAAAVSATHVWLTSPDGVWSSPLPAFAQADVSEDVVAARVEADEAGALAVVELDNAHGAYNAYGTGELGALQPGGRLQLTPGYRTAEGAEVAQPYSYWVESVELVTGARPRLIVRARDAWSLVAQWRARRQLFWAAGDRTVSQIFLFLAARAGLQYNNVSTSAAFTTLEPAFTVHPGESGVSALRRLLALVEDVARVDGGELVSLATADDDAPEYSIGGEGEHTLVEARYLETGPAVNAVRVLGADYFEYGEAYDFDALQAQGERLLQQVDVSLPSAAAGQAQAVAAVRKASLRARGDVVRLFGVHCGVEIYDVVSLTDVQRGLEAAPRRVLGYAWRFEPERGRYDMTLTLGEV